MLKLYNERELFWIDDYKKKIFGLKEQISELTGKIDKRDMIERVKKESQILVDPKLKEKKFELECMLENSVMKENNILEEVI